MNVKKVRRFSFKPGQWPLYQMEICGSRAATKVEEFLTRPTTPFLFLWWDSPQGTRIVPRDITTSNKEAEEQFMKEVVGPLFELINPQHNELRVIKLIPAAPPPPATLAEIPKTELSGGSRYFVTWFVMGIGYSEAFSVIQVLFRDDGTDLNDISYRVQRYRNDDGVDLNDIRYRVQRYRNGVVAEKNGDPVLCTSIREAVLAAYDIGDKKLTNPAAVGVRRLRDFVYQTMAKVWPQEYRLDRKGQLLRRVPDPPNNPNIVQIGHGFGNRYTTVEALYDEGGEKAVLRFRVSVMNNDLEFRTMEMDAEVPTLGEVIELAFRMPRGASIPHNPPAHAALVMLQRWVEELREKTRKSPLQIWREKGRDDTALFQLP